MGTFSFRGAGGFNRTYYLWAIVDDEGEVCAIHYGNGQDFQMASGEIIRSECDTDLKKYAFALAEERWERDRIDEDDTLIDEDDTNWFQQRTLPPCR